MEYLHGLEGTKILKEAYVLSKLLYSLRDPTKEFNELKKTNFHYKSAKIAHPVINGKRVEKAFGIFTMQLPNDKRAIFVAFRGTQVRLD